MLLKLSQHMFSKNRFDFSVVLNPQPTTTFWVSYLNWRPSSEARFVSLLICTIIQLKVLLKLSGLLWL